MAGRPALRRPTDMLEARQQRLDELERRLATTGLYEMERWRSRLGALGERLEALSPTATLLRGYSIALDEEGRPLSSVGQVSPGDALEVVLRDGRVDARAERVRPEGKDGR
jgi:exodeoxyribonuclease VII large subunit